MKSNTPCSSQLTIQKSSKIDWTKLKAFAGNKINATEKFTLVLGRIRKHCGKRRKCWLPAFSPFSTMISNGFLYRIIKSCDCGEN